MSPQKKGTPKTQENLKRLETEKKDLENRLRRALADYDNLKKQTEKEKEEHRKFANRLLIENLIAVWEGLEIVVQQLQNILSSHGVEKIDVSIGDDFDPHLMEAAVSEGDGERVVGIIARGYKLHGRVIKPAKVKVGS